MLGPAVTNLLVDENNGADILDHAKRIILLENTLTAL